MSGVIGFARAGGTWGVAGWAFGRLMRSTHAECSEPGDLFLVQQAEAMHGLHLDLEEPATARRLAQALDRASRRLEAELRTSSSDDPRDCGLADRLVELRASLREDLEGDVGATPSPGL